MGQIKIDDDLLAHYESMAGTVPVATYIERQLAKFQAYPVGFRTVVLTGTDLQALDKRLGLGQIQSAKALVAKVNDYAKVTLGGVEIELTASQKAEIVDRAEKQGKTPEAIVRDLVAQLEESMFSGIPVR